LGSSRLPRSSLTRAEPLQDWSVCSTGMAQQWEIVGGADKGGILVRQGQATSSPQWEDRLSTGAKVEEIELVGERLKYKLKSGTGPPEGWISIKLKGKDLAIPCVEEPSDPAEFTEARCARDLASAKPVVWKPVGMEVMEKTTIKSKGILYGLEFPWDADTLQSMGPAWLTSAFHKAGTAPRSSKVTKLTNVKAHVGGGACAKLFFDVEWDNPAEGLHTKLFAKIPWPLTPATKSDRMNSSIYLQGMEIGEIQAMRLLESRMPFRIPKYYFGDISNETTNFIIITERIPFGQMDGENQVEMAYEKCRDWDLAGPYEEYYYLLIREGAKMAGMYWADKLAPREVLEKMFQNEGGKKLAEYGIGPQNTGLQEKEFQSKIKMGVEFMQVHAKALFPEVCATPDFADKYKKALNITNVYSAEIAAYAHLDPAYTAWSHGNLNVDNVWFWRTPDKELGVGILDWGGARIGSMGLKLWWWLYGCEYEFLNTDIDKLLSTFIEVYQENGGPKLELEELKLQFILAALQQGVGLLGAIPQIFRMCKKAEWPTIKDRKDPRIANNIDGKNTLRIYVMTDITVASMIAEWGCVEKLEALQDKIQDVMRIPKKKLVDC